MAFVFLDRKNIALGVFTLIVIFLLGVTIGYFGRGSSTNVSPEASKSRLVSKINKDQFENEKDIIIEALENVNANEIRSYLKELTKEPHIAGRRRDEELTDWIKKSWTQMGLDHVELATYDFYLSWPNAVSICLLMFIKN